MLWVLLKAHPLGSLTKPLALAVWACSPRPLKFDLIEALGRSASAAQRVPGREHGLRVVEQRLGVEG